MKSVVIVGGGPAAMMAAIELARTPNVEIRVIEEGNFVEKRYCPHQVTGKCSGCKNCSVVKGIAGGGAGSDGKFHPSKGGALYEAIGDEKYMQLMNYVQRVYRNYGKMANVYPNVYGTTLTPYLSAARDRATNAGLKMELHPIEHYGSDGSRKLYYTMQSELLKHENVKIIVNTKVTTIDFNKLMVYTNNKKIPYLKADRIILAPGRSGSDWLSNLCRENNIPTSYGNLILGVRAEVPDVIGGNTGPLVQGNIDAYEPKLRMYFPKGSFVLAAKTFCQCPGGWISYENYGKKLGIAANGYSLSQAKSRNTNVSLLLDVDVRQVEDPSSFIWKYVQKANKQGGGYPIVQTYRSLLAGIPTTMDELAKLSFRSTETNLHPGDLTKVFEPSMTAALIQFIEGIEQVFPGFTVGGDLLLHGVEVKPVSFTPQMDKLMMIAPGIFVAGDGVNLSHGLQPASGSGVYTAWCVIKSLTEEDPMIIPYYNFIKKNYSFAA